MSKSYTLDNILYEGCPSEISDCEGGLDIKMDYITLQYAGLKDKNGLQEVYEGDIIDSNGKIKGNIYQMDNGEADFVIQGFGTKTWCETYRRAILLGLKDSE